MLCASVSRLICDLTFFNLPVCSKARTNFPLADYTGGEDGLDVAAIDARISQGAPAGE